jgi:hypothetical protein
MIGPERYNYLSLSYNRALMGIGLNLTPVRIRISAKGVMKMGTENPFRFD